MGLSPIKPLKSMLSTKCEHVPLGFEKYVHVLVKVQELNIGHANLESVQFSKVQYKYLTCAC